MTDKELVANLAKYIKLNLRQGIISSDDLWVKEATDMTAHIGNQLMPLWHKYKDMEGSPDKNGHRLYKLLMPIYKAFKIKHPSEWQTCYKRGYIHQRLVDATQFEVKSRRTIPMRKD